MRLLACDFSVLSNLDVVSITILGWRLLEEISGWLVFIEPWTDLAERELIETMNLDLRTQQALSLDALTVDDLLVNGLINLKV